MGNFAAPAAVNIDTDGDTFVSSPVTCMANTTDETTRMESAYTGDYIASYWWTYTPAATGTILVRLPGQTLNPVMGDRAATVYSKVGATITRIATIVVSNEQTFSAWPAGRTMLVQGMVMDGVGAMQLVLTGSHTTDWPPVVVFDPFDKTVKEHGTVSFLSTAAGSPTPTVQWQTRPGA